MPRPSSVRVSQSLSMPSQTSTPGSPGWALQAKAVKFGSQIVSKLEVLDHPALNGLIPRLKAANEALKAAGERRDAAFEQVLLQNILRVRRLTALQAAVADIEYEILKRFRGNHALVKVVLSGADPNTLDGMPDDGAPVEAPPGEA